MPDGATRLVSLHDPDALPIRKGRIDKPVEFGYKAQVTDNDDGIVLDYAVEYGAVPDSPQLAPAIERVARRAGVCCARSPPTAATVRPPSNTTCTPRACAPWRFPARPPPRPRARPSSTAAASAGSSSGAPAAKAGSATSNAATAGTVPSWTQARGSDLVRARDIRPQPGQDRGPGQLTPPRPWTRPAPGRSRTHTTTFQVEVIRRPAR
jgi:hypothetical protein